MARRVGVELEFGGLDLERATRVVVAALGGEAGDDGDYRRVVRGTALGEFEVELDFELLHKMNARRRGDEDTGVIAELSEELLAAASAPVVPVEVVCPPIEEPRLTELDGLTRALRRAGAIGTRDSVFYAFGLHLNPELERLEAGVIRDHLRAYLCAYDWLVDREQVDWSRRMVPYIKPFPRDYARLVLAEDYAPDLAGLIDDYLRLNPERNRSLDMLPMFAHLDEAQVRNAVDDARIKPRPTFHYRLPNCDIDRPGWSVMPSWRRWLRVEALAGDRERLGELQRAYLQRLDHPMEALTSDWVQRVAQHLGED